MNNYFRFKFQSRHILVIVIFLSINLISSPAPRVKFWIPFANKIGTPHSISTPSTFLTQKSILRRTTYNIPLHISDLPVTPNYLLQLSLINHVKVLYASKWLNGAVISIDSSAVALPALNAIKSFSFVLDTIRVRKIKLNKLPDYKFSNQLAKESTVEYTTKYKYGLSYGQVKQLEVQCYHDMGYRGQGITIAVLDVGFDNVNTSPIFDSIRNDNLILGTRDFVDGGTNAYQGGIHGCYVMSCMAANLPGQLIGTAPKASYWLLRTEEGSAETISEEYNWIRGAEFADSVGADILTTSLGYTTFDNVAQNHSYNTLNGRTAPMSIAATMAARKGLFVLNAAGNEGGGSWNYISVPADADSICTVGAVDSIGLRASFSSIGPTKDGRIKPDLMACGWNTIVSAGGSPFPGSGTSFATPVLAGAVACFWQKNKNYSNMRLLDTLKKLADNKLSPNNNYGWGVPKICDRITNVLKINSDIAFDFVPYQNVSSNAIDIVFSNNTVNSASVTIIDVVGKKIYSNNFNLIENKISIPAVNFNSGIYFIQVESKQGNKQKKLLKL